jgi:hypothetical protein
MTVKQDKIYPRKVLVKSQGRIKHNIKNIINTNEIIKVNNILDTKTEISSFKVNIKKLASKLPIKNNRNSTINNNKITISNTNSKINIAKLNNVQKRKTINQTKPNIVNIKDNPLLSNDRSIIIPNFSLASQLMITPIARYLATIYNEVLVLCDSDHYEELSIIYRNNIKIKLIPLDNTKLLEEKKEFVPPYNSILLNKLTKQSKKFIVRNQNPEVTKSINWYYNMSKIDFSVFWKYQFIPNTHDHIKLFKILEKEHPNYIFLHNYNDNLLFNLDDLLLKHNLELNDNTLIINPVVNYYEPTHKYYKLASMFVNKKITDYKDIIIYAKQIFITDSEYFIMSTFLTIQTDKCYVIPKNDNTNYDYLWNSQYYTDSTKKKFSTLIK